MTRRAATTPARLTVSFRRVGAGGLIGVASADVEIAGVRFIVNGLEVRRGADGRLQVTAPSYALAGRVMAAVELPDELQSAIGRETEALL